MIVVTTLFIWCDVELFKPELVARKACVGTGKVYLARSKRLYLCSLQRYAGLERIEDLVIMARLAILKHLPILPVPP